MDGEGASLNGEYQVSPSTLVKLLMTGIGGLFLDKTCTWALNFNVVITSPARLAFNGQASKDIEWHCKYYGLMDHFESGEVLAKKMGISSQYPKQTVDKYNAGAKANKDPFSHREPRPVSHVFFQSYCCALSLRIDLRLQSLV